MRSLTPQCRDTRGRQHLSPLEIATSPSHIPKTQPCAQGNTEKRWPPGVIPGGQMPQEPNRRAATHTPPGLLSREEAVHALARQTSEARRHPAATRPGCGRSRNGLGRSRIGRWWDRPVHRWSTAAPPAVERRSSCHCATPVNPARIAHCVGEGAATDNRRCGRPRIGSSGSGVSRPSSGVNAGFAEPRRLATAVTRNATTARTGV